MLTALLDLIAPPRCLACGARAPLPWCAACEDRAIRIVDGACPGCAGRHAGPCPLRDAPFRRVTAAYVYTGVVAAAVVAGKVGGATAAWRPLGTRLAAAMAPGPWDLVVPVPTPARRRRARGVDHAAVLATVVARRLDLPSARILRAAPRAPDQGRAGHHRATLPAGTFQARAALDGGAVLLVDDVLTTGATASAAATALRGAGATLVDVAVLARAGG